MALYSTSTQSANVFDFTALFTAPYFTALYCTFAPENTQGTCTLLHLYCTLLHLVPPLPVCIVTLLHFTALYCTFVLHHTALYCTFTALYCTFTAPYCLLLHFYCTFTAPYCTLLHPTTLSRPFHSKFNNLQITKVESLHDCCSFALNAWGTSRVRTGWGGVGVRGVGGMGGEGLLIHITDEVVTDERRLLLSSLIWLLSSLMR